MSSEPKRFQGIGSCTPRTGSWMTKLWTGMWTSKRHTELHREIKASSASLRRSHPLSFSQTSHRVGFTERKYTSLLAKPYFSCFPKVQTTQPDPRIKRSCQKKESRIVKILRTFLFLCWTGKLHVAQTLKDLTVKVCSCSVRPHRSCGLTLGE